MSEDEVNEALEQGLELSIGADTGATCSNGAEALGTGDSAEEMGAVEMTWEETK